MRAKTDAMNDAIKVFCQSLELGLKHRAGIIGDGVFIRAIARLNKRYANVAKPPKEEIKKTVAILKLAIAELEGKRKRPCM